MRGASPQTIRDFPKKLASRSRENSGESDDLQSQGRRNDHSPARCQLPVLAPSENSHITTPVLLVTGPVGVGKTSVLAEITELLEAAGVAFAAVDLDNLSWCYPSPAGDDRFRRGLTLKNLASVWQNFLAAGARRLVIARVVETRAELEGYEKAVPGAKITVVRLRATAARVQDRVARREIGLGREWHSQRAQELGELMDRERVEDLLTETDERTLNEIAREILTRTGWLS